MSNEYEFTRDWFSWSPEVWEQLIPALPERKRFLEIGSFEGRSAVWTAENMMEDGGILVAVDTWQGGEEHQGSINMDAAEALFDYNMALLGERFPGRKIAKMKMKSYLAFGYLNEGKPFDFIYVDGSHTAKDVLADACMAWPLLKSGGVMVFDDYTWGDPRDLLHRPKLAVDAFVNIYAEELSLVHIGYQLALRKT
jgi:predicted O-methyltransferase YrrM